MNTPTTTEKQRVSTSDWNGLIWFLPHIGSTIWMLGCGIMCAFADLGIGLAIIACYLFTNIVAIALWKKRNTIKWYPAIQILIAAQFVCTFATLCMVYRYNLIAQFDSRLIGRPFRLFGFLWIFPWLMWMMWHTEKQSRKKNQDSSNS